MQHAMPTLSFVVPSYNEEKNVAVLCHRLVEALLPDTTFEIIFVDDGSQDGTLGALKQLAKQHPDVKYISFSRNFGHQAALRAGLKLARGQAVISMDADLQHPPEMVPKLVACWREGHEVVYTIRQDTADTGVFKRFTSKYFYRVLNFLSGLHLDEGAADFRLLDRKIVDLINSQHEADIFLRGYISWLGFNQKALPYVPAKRYSGNSKYSFKKMIALGAQGITQFSVKPLRLAFVLASVALLLSVIYVLYALWIGVMRDGAVPGWLSLVVLIVFFQGVQFLLLGLIGEYLGRTFMQAKQRPEFIVRETNCD